MSELKPCPFCGKMPEMRFRRKSETRDEIAGWFSVLCVECGTEKGGWYEEYKFDALSESLVKETTVKKNEKTGDFETVPKWDGRRKAIDIWNTRAVIE